MTSRRTIYGLTDPRTGATPRAVPRGRPAGAPPQPLYEYMGDPAAIARRAHAAASRARRLARDRALTRRAIRSVRRPRTMGARTRPPRRVRRTSRGAPSSDGPAESRPDRLISAFTPAAARTRARGFVRLPAVQAARRGA